MQVKKLSVINEGYYKMHACIHTLVLCYTDKASCFHQSEWSVEAVNSRGIQTVAYILQSSENIGNIATHQMLC